MAKVAPSAATARSHAATSWQPAAVAVPCTRAITGCGSSRSRSIIREQDENSSRYSASDRPTISDRSCPEQKAGPLAPSTTTLAEGSASIAASASSRRPIRARDSALRRSGRSSVRRTTPPTLSIARPARSDEVAVAIGRLRVPVHERVSAL